ncbi:hypothetical protein IscW_ISCW019449 [Ixodes scapularis]|uniref:Uncharacterized protein n=1 Tax=Ixodes scapularis TaxID=6945 RepID=B7PRT5_IXOSC|nr:hypothetical protein IscW_ISCW019449 [Ixodes scapularis]|eukprot:XP_002401204.1 hypothetical protein IscW_ISCW019449 [Ixodes scapularis]
MKAGDSLSLCPSARSCCTLAAERRLQDASWEKLRALVWANTESLRRFLEDSAASFTGLRYEETKTTQKGHGDKWKEDTETVLYSFCLSLCGFIFLVARTDFPNQKGCCGTSVSLVADLVRGRKKNNHGADAETTGTINESRGPLHRDSEKNRERFGRERVNVFIDEKKIFSKRCSSGRDGGHNHQVPPSDSGVGGAPSDDTPEFRDGHRNHPHHRGRPVNWAASTGSSGQTIEKREGGHLGPLPPFLLSPLGQRGVASPALLRPPETRIERENVRALSGC